MAAVFAGHLVVLDTWGYISSFGTFQAYYASTLGRPPSDISWIGSFQVFLIFFAGVLTGRLTDAGYFRQILALGLVLQVLGIFTASIASEYWQIFLSQGSLHRTGQRLPVLPLLGRHIDLLQQAKGARNRRDNERHSRWGSDIP